MSDKLFSRDSYISTYINNTPKNLHICMYVYTVEWKKVIHLSTDSLISYALITYKEVFTICEF